MLWEEVARIDELPEGGRLSVYVDDTPAIMFRMEGHYYCIEDQCTHDGQPLSDGPIDGYAIVCPRHGAKFDIRNGAPLCMPATEGVRVFEVRVQDNMLQARPADGTQVVSPAAPESTAKPTAENTIRSALTVESTEVKATETTSTEDAPLTGEAKLINALKTVIDPELMINIVDLGLVYEVKQVGRKVNVEMTLTSPACPAGPQIIQGAKLSLEKLADVDEADIRLTMTPPWTPERMTDDARDQLGIF
jgi:metal-sulfur cluster biosynthetic enzyme/nitrite reductase/ring-hydroxylating ferredoxin subunit